MMPHKVLQREQASLFEDFKCLCFPGSVPLAANFLFHPSGVIVPHSGNVGPISSDISLVSDCSERLGFPWWVRGGFFNLIIFVSMGSLSCALLDAASIFMVP